MDPNLSREKRTGPSRSESRPSAEALRKWVDSRNPRGSRPKGAAQKTGVTSGRESDLNRSLKERVEEWGTILLVLGVLIVWARLILAALGVFPLF